MQLLEAHARFALRYESGEYAPFAEVEYMPIDDDLQPLMMCAAASLSGQLDDCADDDDLDDAVRHFVTLVDGGVFTVGQWRDEIMRCFEIVAVFAESYQNN